MDDPTTIEACDRELAECREALRAALPRGRRAIWRHINRLLEARQTLLQGLPAASQGLLVYGPHYP